MIRTKTILLIIFAIFLQKSISTPLLSTTESLILATKTEDRNKENANQTEINTKQPPTITEMNFKTNISNRFATTLVTSKVKNQNSYATEATFFIIIPENAYISGFLIEIDGKSYQAYIKEKEEAKQIYNETVQERVGAPHVAAHARDSNKFTVSVNLEPKSKAIFYLTYQELLIRQKGQYELILNINPGQIVENLNIQVNINESRPITFVRSPSLRSGNEIGKTDDKLDPSADIVVNNLTAIVKFNPSLQKQKELIKEFGTKEDNGLSAQFVVQYDVQHDPFGGEVLVHNGHFVHFYAPNNLPPLTRQIIFVLDTSASMSGTKMPLKEAMKKILLDLKPEDSFSIVQYGSYITIWDIVTGNYTKLTLNNYNSYNNLTLRQLGLRELNLPRSVYATPENINKAINIVNKFEFTELTNIIGALEVGLFLINKSSDRRLQPMIVFLNNGLPNVGINDTNKIIELVTNLNLDKYHVPIFSLSFGHGADRNFLEKLSLKNAGSARHIYEGTDAALQLQELFKLISSPELKDITFSYVANAREVTRSDFPFLFNGSELVVAGKFDDSKVSLSINGFGCLGTMSTLATHDRSVDNLEKLWAYLRIQQLLTEKAIADTAKTEITKKALNLALKYSFVTPITSLVVVKPNSTEIVNVENAGPFKEILDSIINQIFKNQETSSNTTIANSWPFPWLSNVLNPNGTITIPNKGTFEFGNLGNITDHPPCPKTPIDDLFGGECKLIVECREVHWFLIDLQSLSEYFCPLDKYVGVCCPPDLRL